MPPQALPASPPTAGTGELRGELRLDVSVGGRAGAVDSTERGLPCAVGAVRDRQFGTNIDML